MTEKKQASLTTRIVTGMVAGILVGAILQWLMPDGSDAVIPLYLFDLSLRGFLVDARSINQMIKGLGLLILEIILPRFIL